MTVIVQWTLLVHFSSYPFKALCSLWSLCCVCTTTCVTVSNESLYPNKCLRQLKYSTILVYTVLMTAFISMSTFLAVLATSDRSSLTPASLFVTRPSPLQIGAPFPRRRWPTFGVNWRGRSLWRGRPISVPWCETDVDSSLPAWEQFHVKMVKIWSLYLY